MRTISATEPIYFAIAKNDPVAIGVSGGKDSCAMAFALKDWLDKMKHKGPRILIHADLGRTEWKDSLPTCERLSVATGMELMVVRRQAGDMLARWQQRWHDNLTRYQQMLCVQLILPWSTPGMRFCTSELKVDVICAALVRRFPRAHILSASGIRADESSQRSKAPAVEVQKKLCRITRQTTGMSWHPLLLWTQEDVFGICEERGFAMHEAYGTYGSSRVSCCFCILGSKGDLLAAAGCADNQQLYRDMVDLEIKSTFAFQGGEWLGDVAPHLLDESQRQGLLRAKENALARQRAESFIPAHLLYTKGWPTCIPTPAEARNLAAIRREVARLLGLTIRFTTGEAIIKRYTELMARKKS